MQSGNLSFNLLTNPATGDYALNDIVTVTTPDASTNFAYRITWADESGAETLNGNLGAASATGAFSAAVNALGVGIILPVALPLSLRAVTGTPIAVTITVTPSAVGTAAPTADNLGLLYAIGDTGTINSGSGTAAYQVLTVGAGGAVETVTITDGGSTYSVGTGNETIPTSGSGSGLELDILTLSSALEYTYHATLTRNQ
jgi:hypothetical protein